MTTGKGQARQLRQQGLVPANFYGRGRDSRSITINGADMKKLIASGVNKQSLIRLEIKDNDAVSSSVVMIKEYQIDPVKRNLLHADFFEVDLTRPIHIDVPIILHGKPVGVDKGGMLQQITRLLSVSVLPEHIPDHFDLDVSGLDYGQSIHAGDIKAPQGVQILTDSHETIVTVAAPKGAGEEEGIKIEGEEGAAEGEESTEGEKSEDSE